MKKLALFLCVLLPYSALAMDNEDCSNCFGCLNVYFGQLSLYITMKTRELNKEIDYRVADATTDISQEIENKKLIIRTENGAYWKHTNNEIVKATEKDITEATQLVDVVTDLTAGYNRSNGSHTLRFTNGDHATYHQSPKSYAGWNITKKK